MKNSWKEKRKARILKWLEKKSKTLSRKGLYGFLSKEYNLIPAGSKVLTIGSGGEVNKLLAKHAVKQNFSVVSLDIDPNRNPDIIGDICTYDFELKSFDFVILSEVLEHLHSPQKGLDNIYNILNQGGKLILTTPFIMPIHDRPYDYFRFTRFGLELLLNDFRNLSIQERNSYFEAIDVLWMRLLQTNAKHATFASFIIIPCIYYIKRPFSKLLSKFIITDAMTTGYVVTATK